MTEADIEIILQGAKEQYPEAQPRIISDNGPQFIAMDFKEFIQRISAGSSTLTPIIPIASASGAKFGFLRSVCRSGRSATSISSFTIESV
jgi:hypothetical protein